MPERGISLLLDPMQVPLAYALHDLGARGLRSFSDSPARLRNVSPCRVQYGSGCG